MCDERTSYETSCGSSVSCSKNENKKNNASITENSEQCCSGKAVRRKPKSCIASRNIDIVLQVDGADDSDDSDDIDGDDDDEDYDNYPIAPVGGSGGNGESSEPPQEV